MGGVAAVALALLAAWLFVARRRKKAFYAKQDSQAGPMLTKGGTQTGVCNAACGR